MYSNLTRSSECRWKLRADRPLFGQTARSTHGACSTPIRYVRKRLGCAAKVTKSRRAKTSEISRPRTPKIASNRMLQNRRKSPFSKNSLARARARRGPRASADGTLIAADRISWSSSKRAISGGHDTLPSAPLTFVDTRFAHESPIASMVTSDRECSAHDFRERLWPCNTPHMSEDDSTSVYSTVSCAQNSAPLRRIERAGWCQRCRFTVFHL
jgi:hypothetical protein